MNPCLAYIEESDLFAMDFSARLGLVVPAETLSTIESVQALPEEGVTISEESIDASGKRALFRIESSVAGSYEIRVKVTTNQGNTKRGKGTLNVEEV